MTWKWLVCGTPLTVDHIFPPRGWRSREKDWLFSSCCMASVELWYSAQVIWTTLWCLYGTFLNLERRKQLKKKKKRKRFWACYPFGLTWKALTTHVTFNLFFFFSHYPLVKTWHKEYCFQVQSSSHFSWEYYLKSHWWAMQVSQHPEHQYFNDS